jgi:hypothetical protein
MTTREDVLREFIDCRCNDLCDCDADGMQAMADEIARLRQDAALERGDKLANIADTFVRLCETNDMTITLPIECAAAFAIMQEIVHEARALDAAMREGEG